MYEVTTGGKRTEVELIAAQPRGKNVLRRCGHTSVAEDADEENPANNDGSTCASLALRTFAESEPRGATEKIDEATWQLLS